MKTASCYRQQAWNVLSGKWTSPVIATLIAMVLSLVVNGVLGLPSKFMGSELAAAGVSIVTNILSLFILLPLTWSLVCIFLKFLRTNGEEIKFEELFEGFHDYARIFTTLFLKGIYIFLWMLLLIVPGLIKNYSYALTEFILKDEPELSGNVAIEKSMKMMEGHKMELFLLHLSFLGWILLGILTFGIGMLWVAPYIQTAEAAFYEDRKAEFSATMEAPEE